MRQDHHRAADRRPSSEPTSGRIHFDGEDITTLRGTALRHQRRDMQLMFQDPYASLDPRMRVGTILREPLVVQGIGNRAEQPSKVAALLSEVGLNPEGGRALPARVLRRPAPADRLGPGAGARAPG